MGYGSVLVDQGMEIYFQQQGYIKRERKMKNKAGGKRTLNKAEKEMEED